AHRRRTRDLRILARLVGQGDARIVDGERVVAVVEVHPNGGGADAQRVEGLAADAQPRAALVVTIGVVAVQVRVAPESVAGLLARAESPRALAAADRTAQHAVDAVGAVVAEQRAGAGVGLALRSVRAHRDQPGERVGAVSRALRPAQYFDALHVR